MRAGEQVGHWTLVRTLGRGANAEVWAAEHEDGSKAAVKILLNRRPATEPFLRFTQEFARQRELTDDGFGGVLPIIDGEVPGHPTRARPAWFATPIAVPVRRALGSAPAVDAVLVASEEIAQWLSELHGRQIAHRDVKPDNLFQLDEHWIVGDLGLIDTPNTEPLTTGARALGPRYYLAPEMLQDAATADGKKADVYSLGKTMWVLLTGQNFPPPGPHLVQERATSLRSWIEHPRVAELDLLLERMTRFDPDRRPTMGAVATELRACLHPVMTDSGVDPVSIDALVERISALTEPGRRREEAAAELQLQISSAFERLRDAALSPAYNELTERLEGFNSFSNQALTALAELPAVRSFHSQMGWQGLLATKGSGPPVSATLAVGLRANAEGAATFVGLMSVQRSRTAGEDRIQIWRETYAVPVGSAQEENAIREIASQFSAHLPAALAAIEQFLSKPDQQPNQ